MKLRSLFFHLLLVQGATVVSQGQTTLSGNHVIAGNLTIGNVSTKGNVSISGETGNSALPAINSFGDGGLLFRASPGTFYTNTSSEGSQFTWIAALNALRIGQFSMPPSSYWPSSGIVNSVAFSEAYANSNSFAGPYSYVDSLDHGLALSHGTVSYMNMSYQAADYSIAFSYGTAVGGVSLASGEGYTWGGISVAMSGGLSVGDWSTAIGYLTCSYSFSCMAIGRANVAEGSDLPAGLSTDAIFVIGNGTGNPADPVEIRYHDAFVIRRNGNLEMTGKVTFPRQGEVSMGEFGLPE